MCQSVSSRNLCVGVSGGSKQVRRVECTAKCRFCIRDQSNSPGCLCLWRSAVNSKSWGYIAPLGMRSNRIVLARPVQEKASGLPPFKSVLSVFVSTPAIVLTAKQTALAQDMMYVGLLAVLCPLDAKPSRHAIQTGECINEMVMEGPVF